MYLARRLADKNAMRATLSTRVLFSTVIRLTVFAIAGLVLADSLLAFGMLSRSRWQVYGWDTICMFRCLARKYWSRTAFC